MSKILIFDDEHMLGAMYLAKFRLSGFEAKYFDHPPTNIVGLVAWEKPDIISMDILMGSYEMDGFEAAALLKADPRTKNIPLFFLTNLAQNDDIERGLALGADGYLVKANTTPSIAVERASQILRLPPRVL